MPPKRGHSTPSNFRPCLLWPNSWTDQDETWHGGRLGLGDTVLDGDPAPPPQKGHSSPNFGPCLLWPNSWMDDDATWYGGRPQPRRQRVKWGIQLPPKEAQHPHPIFGPCLLWPNGAIFSEWFTEALGTGVYFQWMVHWNVGCEIWFSVNSFNENSDKYSIFSEAFTEMLGSRFYFQWKVHWNNAYGNLISVNSLWNEKLNTIFYGVLHLYLQWMNEWQFGLVIMAVVTSTKLHYADLG